MLFSIEVTMVFIVAYVAAAGDVDADGIDDEPIDSLGGANGG